MKKKIPKTVKINKATMSQREADDTAHSELMARALDHKEEMEHLASGGLTLDARSYAEAAAGLAGDAELRFKKSEKASGAEKINLWGEARVLTELARAHAQAALALKATD